MRMETVRTSLGFSAIRVLARAAAASGVGGLGLPTLVGDVEKETFENNDVSE